MQLMALLALFAIVAAYASPSIIAIMRGSPRWALILVINLLLGWTIVGWAVALAISLNLPLRIPRIFRTRPPERRFKATPPPPVAPDIPAPAAPVSERTSFDPPTLIDESYARWLDGGAALPR